MHTPGTAARRRNRARAADSSSAPPRRRADRDVAGPHTYITTQNKLSRLDQPTSLAYNSYDTVFDTLTHRYARTERPMRTSGWANSAEGDGTSLPMKGTASASRDLVSARLGFLSLEAGPAPWGRSGGDGAGVGHAIHALKRKALASQNTDVSITTNTNTNYLSWKRQKQDHCHHNTPNKTQWGNTPMTTHLRLSPLASHRHHRHRLPHFRLPRQRQRQLRPRHRYPWTH